MKIIGLVGGISWISTMDYYQLINRGINDKLGGVNAAEMIIYSLNFQNVQDLTWEQAYPEIYRAALSLKNSGVSAIVLTANTAHLFSDRLSDEIGLPIIDIIEETAKQILLHDIRTVGLIGTKYTMQLAFYKEKMKKMGINILIPDSQQTLNYIQSVLRDELGIGIINQESRTNFIHICNTLIANGAQGIVLGCTEAPLLLSQADFSYPVFNSVSIHSKSIIDYMIS